MNLVTLVTTSTRFTMLQEYGSIVSRPLVAMTTDVIGTSETDSHKVTCERYGNIRPI